MTVYHKIQTVFKRDPETNFKTLLEGDYTFWGDFQAEGYVARPSIELHTRGGDRIITKIKCKDFRPIAKSERA